jgi:tetratricopeptide (TPR) repeat protein
MRTALHDSAKLASALDAYRRAATIAPDQADTFLRQAIVLTALERADDAAKAVDRAVAIDARLGDDVTAAVAAQERLPPDPVFGDRPDSGPTTLISRSTGLLARIFPEEPAGADPAVPNWIATRWSQQWQGQVNAVAAR